MHKFSERLTTSVSGMQQVGSNLVKRAFISSLICGQNHITEATGMRYTHSCRSYIYMFHTVSMSSICYVMAENLSSSNTNSLTK